jgi:hypothetical protein
MEIVMQRINKIFTLVFLSVLIVQLVSCQNPLMNTSSPTPPFGTLIMSASTLTALPPLSVFYYKGQVTDDKLLLSIKLAHNNCYRPDESIEIAFTFKNLSQEVIVLQSNLDFAAGRTGSGGNLAPFIYAEDGSDVLTLGDYPAMDIFGSFPKTYTEIFPGDEIEVIANYSFPNLVIFDSSISHDPNIPPSGKYFIGFIYSEHNNNDRIWSGQIRSNQIDLCIVGN